MEMEPYPELDAAQMRFDELAELHEQQAARLQSAIPRKEEAVRKYWDGQMEKADKAAAVSKTSRAASGTPQAEDPEFQAMIAPFDRAVSHEESLTMRTEANVEEQAKVVHNLQRIRDGSIEESRSRLKQEEQIFFTAATVIGAILLVSFLLSFTRRK